jgi:hypothetical protein
MTAENNQIRQEALSTTPIPRYSVNQYIKHAASIKQINEWLIDDYRNQLSNLQLHLEEAELLLKAQEKELIEKGTKLQLTEQELGQLKGTSIIQFFLGILSVLLSSYGVNLVTSKPPTEAGWVMISAAIIIQCISFIMVYQGRLRKRT